jgi:HAD superfamily hydrolase (TIGR01484 family)
MTATPLPLRDAALDRVEALFTDVDGTLTTHDRIESQTLAALEKLRESGVRIVLVSGRPAGWGECWARTWPVDGVIVENGGLYFVREPGGRLRKRYVQPEATREANRRRLVREVNRAMRLVPGARLSTDSVYTEVDLAIDYNEEARLGPDAAGRLEELLRAKGIQAVRSSVHVNCWIGSFDKLKTARRFLAREWKQQLAPDDVRFAYVGDSFNDAPMFDGFALSVGVANVRRVLDRIENPPRFITRAAEGAGVRELVSALLAARRRRSVG